MIDSPKQSQDLPLKQEEVHHHHEEEKAKASSSSNSSQWLRLKDPRIVRVSRAFGGKDRHSKVCTVRGLRDRRVRLSVPTAIQLYDLQDRLGLNQPSKVVDWLLNAAKNEIDELPPLPNFNIIPQLQGNNNNNNNTLGGFPLQSSMMMINNNASNDDEQVFNNRGIIHHQLGEGTSKPREEVVEEKSNWMMNKSSTNEEEEDDKQGSNNNKEGTNSNNTNTNSVLPIIRPNHHHPSFLGLLNTMPIGNYQWETTTSSCDNVVGAHQLGNHNVGFTNQTDYLHHHGINVVPFPSTLSLLSTGNSSSNNNNSSNLHQILVCPPPLPHGSTTQSYFPSSSSSNNNATAAAMELMDPRQINHYQMLTSQNLLTTSNSPNHLSFSLAMMTPRLLNSPNTRESLSHHKEHDFPSK